MIGQTLAHYEIVEKLGSGGMGDVYLAVDTKLDRRIALKVLPPELAGNEERRARFQREAKVIAALNHPNIVTVHSVEEAGGVHFITMEYVRGKTLLELIPKKGITLDGFFDLATPLAEALAAAHEQGIVHRDIKPGNVIVGQDGVLKVLDFGLAHAEAPLTSNINSESPTELKTREGMLAGTLSYMSPEQVEGKSVDARSDIFALGTVFYEILTGARPFRGGSPAATLSAILKDTPAAIHERRSDLPNELGRLVRRCLAKDPERRYQTCKDVRNELDVIREELRTASPEAVPDRAAARKWQALAAAALIAGAVGYAVRASMDPGAGDDVPRFINPRQVTSAEGLEGSPSWSPDGRTLAYESNQSGNWDIWILQVGSGEALNRTTDHDGDDRFPNWSPDGREIAFWSSREGGGCFVASGLAGAPRKISSARFYGSPQWSADGERIACPNFDGDESFLDITDLERSDSTRVVVPGDRLPVIEPTWSPDERLVAFLDSSGWPSTQHPLRVLNVSAGTVFDITDGLAGVWSPQWTGDGRHLFFVSDRGGSLDVWRQQIAGAGERLGSAEPLTVGLRTRSIEFAADGTRVAYSSGRRVANVWRVPAKSDVPSGWQQAEQLTFDQALVELIDVSADGDRLLFDSDRAGARNIWSKSLSGGELRQLTASSAPDWNPRPSRDGRSLAFYSMRSGNREIWISSADGDNPTQLTRNDVNDTGPTWSQDGRSIAFSSMEAGSGIYVLSLDDGNPRRLSAASQGTVPDWSPIGDEIVYWDQHRFVLQLVSIESGKTRVVVSNDAGPARFDPSGNTFYFLGAGDRAATVWAYSMGDERERLVADLSGRRGALGFLAVATDGDYVYFTWEDDLGDIWVMDVVEE